MGRDRLQSDADKADRPPNREDRFIYSYLYPSTFPLLSPQLNLQTFHQLLFSMASGLYHMSQAASGSNQLKTQMDPTLQAQATALRLLAARADKLRDSILNLLNIIQQDPVGERTRQSILPW
jgi:hypothetical protein